MYYLFNLNKNLAITSHDNYNLIIFPIWGNLDSATPNLAILT